MTVNNLKELSSHTNAIPELWIKLQIHYVKWTRRAREENTKFSQNFNNIEAAQTLRLFGEWFFFLSSLWALSFPDAAQKEKLRDEIKIVLIMFLGCLNPKEGTPGVQVLDRSAHCITLWILYSYSVIQIFEKQ